MVNIFDKILGDEEQNGEKIDVKGEETTSKSSGISRKDLLFAFLVFLIAFVPRALYLFVFSNPNFPGWYTDVFHHWQIAYLSKEVGFSHGFLRLWDFKGMEFFWGLLHPLVLVFLFYITGSISIIIPRLLSIFGGSLSIVFLYFLIRRRIKVNCCVLINSF